MNQYNTSTEGGKFVETPSSNTGSQRTGKQVLIDYLAFTFPVDRFSDISDIAIFLNMPIEGFAEAKGGSGYLKRLVCGNIHLLYEGTPGMGYHIRFTGQGCREYEKINGGDWISFFKEILNKGGHFTRVDSAVDVYSGELDIEIIKDKIVRRDLVTRFSSTTCIESHDLSRPGIDGFTVSFGRRSSDAMIRIYDKANEQHVDYSWIRCELEVKNKRADKFISALIDGESFGHVTASVIMNYLNFKDPSFDSNKSRWSTSVFWLSFLDGVSRLALTIKAAERTIEKKKEWLYKQVSATLVEVLEHEHRGQDFIDDLLVHGHSRLYRREGV